MKHFGNSWVVSSSLLLHNISSLKCHWTSSIFKSQFKFTFNLNYLKPMLHNISSLLSAIEPAPHLKVKVELSRWSLETYNFEFELRWSLAPYFPSQLTILNSRYIWTRTELAQLQLFLNYNFAPLPPAPLHSAHVIGEGGLGIAPFWNPNHQLSPPLIVQLT